MHERERERERVGEFNIDERVIALCVFIVVRILATKVENK